MKDYRLKEVAQNVLRPLFEETTRSAYQEFMNDNNIPKTISDQAEKLAIIGDAVDKQLEDETDVFLSTYADISEENATSYAQQYFKEEIDMTFSYAFIEDEFDIEQLKKERLKMAKTELRSFAMVTLYDLLEEKLEEIYQDYMEQNKMPGFISNASKYHDVVRNIANKQTDLGVDEFLDEYVGLPDDDIQECVKEYVEENYDRDFLFFNIEQALNYEEMKTELVDDMVLGLENTEPYGNASSDYWKEKAESVQSVSQLAGYVTEQNFNEFVETYALDWEEFLED